MAVEHIAAFAVIASLLSTIALIVTVTLARRAFEREAIAHGAGKYVRELERFEFRWNDEMGGK